MPKESNLVNKKQVISALIAFFAVFTRAFFDSSIFGMLSVKSIVFTVLMSVAFSVCIFFSYTDNQKSSFSAQHIVGTALVFLVMGSLFSYNMITYDVVVSILVMSIIILFSQNIFLLPFATGIAMIAALKISTVAYGCIPAAIGVSCVLLAGKFKEAKKPLKIVFAVSEVVMVALTVYSYYYMRNVLTFHSLKTEMWDSVLAVLVGVVLIASIIRSVKTKKSFIEIFGYIVSFTAVPYVIFMDLRLVFIGTACLLMALFVISGKDNALKETIDAFVNAVTKKLKKSA